MFKVGDVRVYFKHEPNKRGFLGEGILDGVEYFATEYEGYTQCFIIDDKAGEHLSFGEAFCSVNDQFYKPTGRKVSLSRALEGMDKEFRTKIWNAYREASNK